MSTMKCRSCHSPMMLERCESSTHATTSWHRCPVCRQVRMTSDPQSASRSHAVTTLKDEDRVYATEPDSLLVDTHQGYATYLMT